MVYAPLNQFLSTKCPISCFLNIPLLLHCYNIFTIPHRYVREIQQRWVSQGICHLF